MGKKTKTPDAVDPIALGKMQGIQNEIAYDQNMNAMRPNQSSAAGSIGWAQDPNSGQWFQQSNLSAPNQDLYNRQLLGQQMLGDVTTQMLPKMNFDQIALNTTGAGVAGMPNVANYESLGDMPQVGQYNQQATDLTRQLMQPDLDRANDAARARAAAMGLGAGSGAGNNFMEFQNSQRSNDAALKAALAGINQGNIMFGQGMDRYRQGAQNLTNQFQQGMGIHQQGMRDVAQNNNALLQQASGNLGQLSGLMGLMRPQSAIPEQAGIGSTPSLAPIDWQGIMNNNYQQQMNATNAQNADNAAKGQAAGTVITAAAAVY